MPTLSCLIFIWVLEIRETKKALLCSLSVSSSKWILLPKADNAFYTLSLLNVSPFPFPLSLFSLSHLGYWNAYPSSAPFCSVSSFRANLPSSPTVIFLKENFTFFFSENFTFVRTLLKNFELFRIVWKFPNIAFRLVIFEKKKKIDFPEYSTIRLNWTNTEIKQNCFLLLGLSWGFMVSMSWLLLHIKVSRCLLSKSELILEALEDTTSFMMLSANPNVTYFPPFVFSQTPFPFLEEISQLYFCMSIFYIF